MSHLRLTSRAFVAVLAMGSTALLPSILRAQTTPPQQSPVAAAAKQVDDARKHVMEARNAFNAARAKIEQRYKADPNWGKIQQAYDKAKADVAAAERPALEAARNKPEYVQANNAKAAAQKQYEALNQDPAGNAAALSKVGDELARESTLMNQLEREALENDPKVIEAKAHLHDATQQLGAMKQQVDLAAKSDPECQRAQQAVASAEQQLTSATTSLTSARQAAASAAKARAEAERAKSSQGR